MMRLATSVLLSILAGPVLAQATVERKVEIKPGEEGRIGVYANVRPDCTSGPLPTVTLSTPPQNGMVRVRPARVRLTNHKNCLAVEVQGYVATYKPRTGFSGTDQVGIEVKAANGAVIQRQNISLTVSVGSIAL